MGIFRQNYRHSKEVLYMARRGENIYKRKDGRWEGRYIKGKNLNNKSLYGYVYGKSYREVKAKLLHQKNTIECRSNAIHSTVQSVAEAWLISIKDKLKHSTYVKYYNITQNHIICDIGKVQIENLSTQLINNFIESKLLNGNLITQKGLSIKTVKDIISVLKLILKYATTFGIKINCVFDNSLLKSTSLKTGNIPTIDRENLLKYLCNNTNHINIGILISLYTGIRIGELCALKFEDISIESKVIHISKTLQRLQRLSNDDDSKTEIVISSPKSNNSIRDIPIPDFIIKLIIDNNFYDPNAYILTGRTDRYIEPRTLENKFKRVSQECKIESYTFHTLRHTFATNCIEVGDDPKTLSEILGHSNVNITLNRYVHTSLELKQINMARLYQNPILSPSII